MAAADLTGDHAALRYGLDMVAIAQPSVSHDWEAVVLEQIATNAPIDETLPRLVALVETQIPEAIGSLLLLDPVHRTLHAGAAHNLPAAFNAAVEGIAIGPSVGSCGTAAYLGRPVFVEDIASDPRWAAFRELALAHGLRACWSTPVLSRRTPEAPAVLGTFAVYFRAPRAPDPIAEAVLDRASALTCIALEAARTTADLRDSEARFRALVDHATDGLFIHDPRDRGRVVDVNRQACESLGYTRDELIGALPSIFDPVVDQAALDRLRACLAAGDTVTFRSVHRRKDGSRFPVEVRARTFVAQGRPLNHTLVRDITASLELEERRRQAQKLEAISRLAGGVAHDFNNLLTVILAHAEGVLPSLTDGDPRRDDLEAIHDAAHRAAGLTAQLLAFSRRAITAPEPVDLNALVTRLAQMLARLIGEPIALTLALAPGEVVVRADPGQLEQVLVNLVVNARDAMPRGGQLAIATAPVDHPPDGPPQRCVSLTVTDTGEGMTDDVKARLFEPFFTTRPPGKGSGLGLATCYGIVTQAGGQIRIESAPGRGTRVEVVLPLVEATARPTITAAVASATILYVEDEDAVRRVTARALERWGYTVLTARDGKDALAVEARHDGAIDLLLTDVVMPNLGGRALADRIKARRPAIAIVYMSGYTDDEVVREGVNAGVDAFVQKPFTLHALGERLRAILAGHAAG